MTETTREKHQGLEKAEADVIDATMRKVMMHATMAVISFFAILMRPEIEEYDFMANVLFYSIGTLLISFVVDNWMWTSWELVPQLFLFTMFCRGLTIIRVQVNKCIAQSETLMCEDRRVVPLYIIYFLLLGSCGIMIISTVKLGIRQYHRT